MNSLQVWITAARPKTLCASISPVVLGSILAFSDGAFKPLMFFFTLMTALGIQISTNLANDYFDFIKGADTKDRKGPLRVTQAGLSSLSNMKKAILLSLSFTTFVGLYLVLHGGLFIACLLFLSLLLAILYTAGPFSLAYLGLGDLFVFSFFGPVAILGTYFLQTKHLSLNPILVGLGIGAISTAIICVNNLRDIAEDALVNKKTLAVRFGKSFAKIEYLFCLTLPAFIPFFFITTHPFSLFSLLFLFPAIFCLRTVFTYKDPKELNNILVKTGQLLIIYTAFFSLGWIL
ncbi:MAG: 1,4-dihydroxy-2-naphthoate polyprenyltransferase [Verrucomicrobia bacterium]|nr:1,4-dihydroxy-2-naphthoate polyprenyltransferase [Verrucomicrobiota bacterium]